MARAAKNIMSIGRRGMMLVLSSPSGAGKTTLSRKLLNQEKDIDLSISVTTRKPRPGEVHGHHYYFISSKKFNSMVESNQLLEWAEVFGNFYGTPRKQVMKSLKLGRDILFDIDWQGTQQLREQARDDLASIFVLPPSMKELERRLRARAQDDAVTIKDRMSKASSELGHWAEYDYVILNDSLNKAFEQVRTILAAERLKRQRQPDISSFVRALIGQRKLPHHSKADRRLI
jgi:guanylate kinase